MCLGIGDVGAEFGGRFAIISGFWGFGIGGCPWEIRDFDSVKVEEIGDLGIFKCWVW